MITHKGLWGADRTAHSASLALDPTKGYVITKAEIQSTAVMVEAKLGENGYRLPQY